MVAALPTPGRVDVDRLVRLAPLRDQLRVVRVALRRVEGVGGCESDM